MASYNPPNPYVPGAFNPNQFITPSANITTQYLDENYLRFPFAQGAENFVAINNQGQLNQGGKAEFSSATIPVNFLITPTITTPFTYPDTTHTSSLATIGYVNSASGSGSDLLPLDNDWTGINNFNYIPNGLALNMEEGLTITGGLLNGQQTSSIVNYNPTSIKGLSLFSLSSTNNIYNGNSAPGLEIYSDGLAVNINANGSLGTSLGSINLLAAGEINMESTLGVNINGSSIIYFSSGSIGESSNGEDIKITADALPTSEIIMDAPGGVILPAQTTYTPSTTYGNVGATQQFVQLALASQGSGDVTLGGTNNFTGTNTFNVNPPTSTIIQSSLNTTQFATIGYVNGIVSETYPPNALTNGEYVGSGGAGTTYTSNVTGSITGNYIGVNTIQVLPTTITCTASIEEGGDSSETITFDLARALAPNNLYSSTLSGLSATITPSSGQLRGCQLIAGYDAINQIYTLSAFVNQNNYFDGTDTYTISFTGIINYIPL
jgi:hypothetical protein